MSLPFIGRNQELATLSHLLHKRSASLVILQGRRRIGKSRLIAEFAKRAAFDKFYIFSGLPPTPATTAQSQRDEFSAQLGKALNIPTIKADDWNTLFWFLAGQVKHGKVLLLFDEISWMGSLDFDFLGKLKNAWDWEFSKNPKLVLVLCGSVSAWIEKNIVQSTGFLGRPSLYMTLEALSLAECNQFFGKYGEQISPYEKLKLLSVVGGVPRYLELIDPTCAAEENIKRLCFMKDSPLLHEFEFIFSDIFARRSPIYRRIIAQLLTGAKTQEEIAQSAQLKQSGDLSDYLNELVISGFIARDYTWHLQTGQVAKLSKYRLKDNYLRFYLKYLRPYQPKIEKGIFSKTALVSLPNWDIIMGLQFENLVLNSYHEMLNAIGIQPEEVVFSNPFFQRLTAKQPGCQIDYLIQTKFSTAYVCEIKFARGEIGFDIIAEVKQKIARLKLPRHFSYRPVLIHVNGVCADVIDSDFFARIIDFGQLLK